MTSLPGTHRVQEFLITQGDSECIIQLETGKHCSHIAWLAKCLSSRCVAVNNLKCFLSAKYLCLVLLEEILHYQSCQHQIILPCINICTELPAENRFRLDWK